MRSTETALILPNVGGDYHLSCIDRDCIDFAEYEKSGNGKREDAKTQSEIDEKTGTAGGIATTTLCKSEREGAPEGRSLLNRGA